MSKNTIEKNKLNDVKKIFSHPGLTWLTRDSQHEIGIKKYFLKNKSRKKKDQS
jgi:hypothetical protein